MVGQLVRTEKVAEKGSGPMGRRARDLGKVVWGFVVCAYFALAAGAPLLVPYEQAVAVDLRRALRGPGWDEWLGRDELGRRVDARIVWGARNSLAVAGFGVGLGGAVGVFLGSVAGYRRGSLLDRVVGTGMDVLLAVPRMLLALMVVALTGQSREGLMLAVGLSALPSFARLSRGVALRVAVQEYVVGAVAAGAGELRILLRHVLPNVVPVVIPYAALSLAHGVLVVTALGFLGLGSPPPAPEWGSMMSTGRTYLWTHPHLVVVPGVAVALFAVALSQLGDRLEGR
ncbi:MAG: ABC transporter permease [bacterium]